MTADGAAKGNDGCNEVIAEWSATSDAAGTFVVTGATEMACPDVPGWSEARTYALVDDDLVIESSGGTPLTTLERD